MLFNSKQILMFKIRQMFTQSNMTNITLHTVTTITREWKKKGSVVNQETGGSKNKSWRQYFINME